MSALGAPRPVHLRRRCLGLVAVGGMLGTSAREGLSLAFPPVAGVPITTAMINVVGAFLLGLLLESLVRRGADVGRRRVIRLLVGTGVLGGFTTYSALSTDTVLLLRDDPALGVAYALGTVLIGAFATLAGVLVGAWWHRRRTAAS